MYREGDTCNAPWAEGKFNQEESIRTHGKIPCWWSESSLDLREYLTSITSSSSSVRPGPGMPPQDQMQRTARGKIPRPRPWRRIYLASLPLLNATMWWRGWVQLIWKVSQYCSKNLAHLQPMYHNSFRPLWFVNSMNWSWHIIFDSRETSQSCSPAPGQNNTLKSCHSRIPNDKPLLSREHRLHMAREKCQVAKLCLGQNPGS